MKNFYNYINSFLISTAIMLGSLLVANQASAQQAIGAHPNIDAGFESQSAGSSVPTGNPNRSATIWSYVSSGNGQIRLVTATGGYGGPKYFSVGKNNPTQNTSTTANSNIVLNPFQANTKYIVQFHYKQNLGTPDTASYVFISLDGSSANRDKTNIALGTPANWTKFTTVITTNNTVTPTDSGVCGMNIKLVGTANGSTSAVVDFDNFVVYPADDQATPLPDVTAPNAPTGLSATAGPAVVNLSWTAPAGGVDAGGYLVVRYISNPASQTAPLQNAVYKANATNLVGTDGVVVYVGDSTHFSDGSGVAGTNYWYKVYAVDKAFNYSATAPTAGPVSPLPKINYYYDGTGSTDLVTNWWTNKNFTGSNPANFTDPGMVMHIITNADLVSTLAITGTGSTLIIGDASPVPAVTVTFNSINLPGIDTIYQSSNGNQTILNFNTSAVPSINQLVDIFTEAHYRATGTSVGTSKIYDKIFVENNADVVFTGSPTVTTSFRVEAGATATVGTLSTKWLVVSDGGTATINGKLITPKLTGLVSSNVATPASTFGAIQFVGVGDVVLGPNSTVEYSGISTQTTQTITPRTDYVNMIISGVGISKTLSGNTSISANLTMNTSGSTGLILLSPLTVNGALTLTRGKINTDATNILTLASAATVSGGNSASYVSGPMKVNTASTSQYKAPIGKNGMYRPAGIKPSAATSTVYQAEFFNAAYSDLTFLSPLTNVDTTYWTITRASGTANAQISLALDSFTLVPNSNDPSSEMVVAKYDGADWASISQTAITPLPTLTGTATSTVVSSFGNFTFGLKPVTIVPLKLISFKGTLQKSKAYLTWITAEERNLLHFVIEESKDAKSFRQIGAVNANNLTSNNTYSFISTEDVNGISYFRIKMVDIDGKYQYSSIITLKNEQTKKLTVAHSVDNNESIVMINNIPNGIYHLNIYSSNGQLIQQQSIQYNGSPISRTLTLNESTAKGFYLISLIGTNVAEHQKIIIQ